MARVKVNTEWCTGQWQATAYPIISYSVRVYITARLMFPSNDRLVETSKQFGRCFAADTICVFTAGKTSNTGRRMGIHQTIVRWNILNKAERMRNWHSRPWIASCSSSLCLAHRHEFVRNPRAALAIRTVSDFRINPEQHRSVPLRTLSLWSGSNWLSSVTLNSSPQAVGCSYRIAAESA